MTEMKTLNRLDYLLIGRVFAFKNPSEANKIISVYRGKGLETDYNKIPFFFSKFCEFNKLNPVDYHGRPKNIEESENRKAFISCMIRIYCPHVYDQHKGMYKFPKGFISPLGILFSVKINSVLFASRQVIFLEKTYEDYAEKVKVNFEHLKQFI